MSGQEDRALVARVVGYADERAFDILYRRHTPALYLLALRRTGGRQADAEDLVHDAWIRAVERLGGFEWRSALRTWIAGILVNRFRETLRQGQSVDAPASEELQVEDIRLSGAIDRIDLERAIGALPPGYRAVLILHDIEGHTHEEIGRLLTIAPGTSKSQLSRARRELRLALRNGKAGQP